jgi:hypothetical protein
VHVFHKPQYSFVLSTVLCNNISTSGINSWIKQLLFKVLGIKHSGSYEKFPRRLLGCVMFDRVRDRAGINHGFLNESLDFWLFDLYVSFGFIVVLFLQVTLQHYVQSCYSCFKLHIEHSMLLSSCSLSFYILVSIRG